MSVKSNKTLDSDPRPPLNLMEATKNNEKKHPALYGRQMQNDENFEKINKLLQRAEQKMFSKQTNFGHLQMKKQIELYEAVITELGLDLQKQDLLPYATMLTKIFQGFRLLYKKAQNLPLRHQSQNFELDKYNKQMNNTSQLSQSQLPQINSNINSNMSQTQQNIGSQLIQQQQNQYQTQNIQNQTQSQNTNINLIEQSFQNDIFQTPQHVTSGLNSAQNARNSQNYQQQILQQQQLNSTDGFVKKASLTQTNQKKQYLFSDQISQSNIRQNTLTQGTMASTFNSNFPNLQNSQLQNKNTQFEGQMGGVLLEQENQTAFTEIIYDQNVVTFKHSTQTHQEKEQSKKSNKYKNSKQLFRRKNYDDRPKLLAHKGTDTGEDFQNALKDWDQPQKLHQLRSIMEESEENIKELTKQIENQHKIVDKEYSKVDVPIGELAKSLRDRQFDTAQFFAKQNFESDQEIPQNNLELIKQLLAEEFTGVQKETAMKIFDYVNMVLKDRDQRRYLLSPSNQGDKTSTNKGKKNQKNLGFDGQGKNRIDDLQKKIKEAEKQFNDVQSTLEARDSEMISLQTQLHEKEKNLNKLKGDLSMTEAMYTKQDQKSQQLKQENSQFKKMQQDLQNKNINFEKQIKDTEKSLKEERQKLFHFESENKKLSLQLNIIKQQTSNMTIGEQAQISKLCDQIMSSDLSEEQKQQCLQQISDFYKSKDLSDKDKQKFKQNMLNQIKNNSKENSRPNSNYSREDYLLNSNQNSGRSHYYKSHQSNGRVEDDNDYDDRLLSPIQGGQGGTSSTWGGGGVYPPNWTPPHLDTPSSGPPSYLDYPPIWTPPHLDTPPSGFYFIS